MVDMCRSDLDLKHVPFHRFAELVDSYESQISVLKKQLQVTGGAEVTVSSEVTPKYKSLIKVANISVC